jgi:glucose/arabinose dehydrogenase
LKSRTIRIWPIGFALATVACGGSGSGETPPPPVPAPACSEGISTPRTFPELTFDSPVAMKQAPLDASRWFVVEQAGLIRVFDNDEAVTATLDFLDIRARVIFSGEAGLLGLAFHPDFAVNGRAFVNYSELAGGTRRSITSEFTSIDGGATLDADSERVLLTVDMPANNHNGGNLAFGPDKFLYIGLGDGGGAGDPQGNAQNPRRLLGKMLRIDVDVEPGGAPYGIPAGSAGNPFAGNPPCNVDGTGAQNCPEIYALGFRNPWRWSFDRQTGELWVGDVGQNSFEEINRV